MSSILAVVGYHQRNTRRTLALVWGLLLLILALSLSLPAIFEGRSVYSDFSDGGLFGLLIITQMFTAAHSDTNYLLTRPLSRRSIWLGNMAFILMMALVLSVARLALSWLGYGAMSALIGIAPGTYSFAAQDSWGVFAPGNSLSIFLDCLTSLGVAGLFAYAYACLLRRWKAWTIILSIAIPALSIAAAVTPIVYLLINDFEYLVDSGDPVAMMQVLPYWMNLIQQIVNWFAKYYNLVYWTAAASTLPISFFTMRTTRNI